MRDLAAQISIAAKRIRETMKSDYNYFSQVEKMAKTVVRKDKLRTAIARQAFPPKGLVNLFKFGPRKITFCLGFVDTSKKIRSLNTDLSEFNSNIAKYSLVELAQDLRLMGFDFKVAQIPK